MLVVAVVTAQALKLRLGAGQKRVQRRRRLQLLGLEIVEPANGAGLGSKW